MTAPSTPAASSHASTASVNYGQQFLADVEPWNVATAQMRGSALDSPATIAAGEQAAAVARRLLSQSWPAADLADVHALAVQFDLIDEDIRADDQSKYVNDGSTLNADANVVRAELGLAAIS